MPSTSHRRRDLRAVADAQAGLITAAQLAELGVLRSTTSRRVAGYMWTRVLPGIHLLYGGWPTRHQRELAAVLYAGPGSMMTGISALRHYGVRAGRLQEASEDSNVNPEPVHILIPHERRRLSTGYVRIERTTRLPERPTYPHGIPMAPLVRAAGDAVRRLPIESDVLAILSELVQRDLAKTDDLVDELTQGNRRGSAHFRTSVRHLLAGVRSGPEGALRTLVEGAGLSHVRWNITVVAPTGEYVADPDAWCDDVGLALEVDSQEYHGFGHGLRRTIARNARYARHGVLAFPVMPERLRQHPEDVRRELLQAHAAAAARPRPDVRIVPIRGASAGRPGWRWGA